MFACVVIKFLVFDLGAFLLVDWPAMRSKSVQQQPLLLLPSSLITWQLGLLFLGSFVLRMLLQLSPSITNVLSTRVELVTTFVGLPYIREVAFLQKMRVRIYDYGNCLPMPIVVALMDLLQWSHLEGVFLALLDLLIATYLVLISHRIHGTSDILTITAAAYLLNPFSVLSSAAKSTTSLILLTQVGSLYHSMTEDVIGSVLYIALGTSISVHPVAMLAPAMVYLPLHKRKTAITLFISTLIGIFAISWGLTGTWRFMWSSIGSRLSYAELKPNVGLYWYLFALMFDFFRPLFAAFLQIHSLFYPFPIFARFRKDPLFMGFLVIALQALLQPYPTVADSTLYLSMIPLFPKLFKELRTFNLCMVGLLFVSVLAPVNWYYWVHQGSGNANFYYATTLCYNICQVVLIVDLIRTHIWSDVLVRNPTLKPTDLYQK